MQQRFLDLLACPLTGEELELKEGELFTKNTSYPIFENIPWLFKNPEYSYLEWATKIEGFIQEEQDYERHLNALHSLSPNDFTKDRFAQILEAKAFNLEVLKQTLSQFLGQKQIRLMPSKQQIHSYYQLIFRDWVWSNDESRIYLNHITKKIDELNGKKILVLGSGACGLSYQLAKNNPDSTVIATDHNPFLFFIANKVINGDQVQLYDYSYYPKHIKETSKKYKIHNQQVVSNHHQVLSSFPNLPFKIDEFDIVICPWFLDILEIDFESAFNSAIKFLKPNGDFICIGPSNKHCSDLTEQLTSTEMNSILQPSFENSNYINTEVTYLENPIESHKRLEDVFMFHGNNKKDQTQKIQIVKKKSEIILTPELAAFKQKIGVYNRILNNIDSDMNFEQLAKKLVIEFEFSKDEAEFYAESFIKQIKDEL